jgi:hypothetical protein
MLNELLPDPAALFRFKIDVHRLPTVDKVQDVLRWGLEEKHLLPMINCAAVPPRPIKIKMGWNLQGLFIESQIELGRQSSAYESLDYRALASVNSRYDPSILREGEHCATFLFLRDKPVGSLPFLDNDPSKVEALSVSRSGSPANTPSQQNPSGFDLVGKVKHEGDRFDSWHFIGAAAMRGYRPEEFPEIGLHLEFNLIPDTPPDGSNQVAMNGLLLFHLDHSHKSGARSNPSLWTHCRLI